MRRIIGLLTMALTVGVFGGVQPAKAAAFLWIAAPNWSYSAAACIAPPAFASFWGLSVGRGSVSFAFAGCGGAFGASGAFAIARAGFGGAGGAFALGFADPYAGVGVDTTLTNAITADSSGNYNADSTGANSELGSDTFSIGPSGVTFPSETETELNAVDELAVYAIPTAEADYADNSDVCALLGESCTPGSGPDVTTIAALDTLLGSAPLATETDPTGDAWDYSIALPPGDSFILVAEGDAVSNPEPDSILVFVQGLLLLGLTVAWRRRQRS